MSETKHGFALVKYIRANTNNQKSDEISTLAFYG